MSHFSTLRPGSFLRADEGQALVLTALGLMMFMLVAALGLDIGYLRYQKEQMQKAADAAAIAGATALSYRGDWLDAALNDATSNGFTNGNNGVTVAVNNPPAAGDLFAGNANYVQVIVSKPISTFFLKVANLASVNVASHAVANSAGNASGCLYALDPADSGSFVVDGGVNLGVTCGIYVNSSSLTALLVNGASGGISVDGAGVGIGVVGGYAGEGLIPTPTTGIPPFTDPLNTVPEPSHLASCINQTGTQLHPNVYCNGLHFTTGAYTLSAGTYVLLGGGLTIASGAQVTGNGVIFYSTSDASHPYGGTNITGSATSLSAPTTGTYAGILFFQDRSVPIGSAVSTFDESSGATLTGALYFPTTKVQFKGIPPLASFNPIDSWQIEFQGAATIKDNFLAGGGSPIPGAVLVE